MTIVPSFILNVSIIQQDYKLGVWSRAQSWKQLEVEFLWQVVFVDTQCYLNNVCFSLIYKTVENNAC